MNIIESRDMLPGGASQQTESDPNYRNALYKRMESLYENIWMFTYWRDPWLYGKTPHDVSLNLGMLPKDTSLLSPLEEFLDTDETKNETIHVQSSVKLESHTMELEMSVNSGNCAVRSIRIEAHFPAFPWLKPYVMVEPQLHNPAESGEKAVEAYEKIKNLVQAPDELNQLQNRLDIAENLFQYAESALSWTF